LKKLILLIVTLTFISTGALLAEDFGSRGALSAENLTLVNMLTYAIQDEYLARAEYAAIMQEYGPIKPFSNIIKSEERHISWLVPLFEQYGFEIPEDNASDHIILPKNVKTALEIGVQAELDNIAMYEVFLEENLPEDVRDVFERLMAASKNHLEAFRRGLVRYT
jgi:hypothetical protein